MWVQICLAKKNVGQKKIWVKKIWVKNNLGSEICLGQKKLRSEIFLGQHFCVKKKNKLDIFLGKKMWVGNCFG